MKNHRARLHAGLPALALAVGALACAGPAFAWEYHEHYEVTLKAFDKACAQLRDPNPAVREWCGNTHVRVCFAHLVAAAADHVGDVADFRAHDGRTHEYLVGKALNCHNPSGWPKGPPASSAATADATEISAPQNAKVQPLVAENLSRFLEYARLASTNFDHFQPDARIKWADRFRTMVIRGDLADINGLIWNAGFALHFLQDSFSAGHNGLRRKPLRQDYAQLYHDDFNSHGLLLGNASGQEWFTYGDRNLDKRSRYAYLGAGNGEPVDLARSLAALGVQATLMRKGGSCAKW
jgi:hypothetical protein